MVETDQLLAFERIVREGSFSKAAFALGISQPTISARIQALEKSLGGAVFTRGRTVHLTERGTSFLPYARRALAVLNDGLNAAKLAASGEQGALRVAALRSLTVHLLARSSGVFMERFPEVQCTLFEGDHWLVIEQLHDGVVELGLICYPPLDYGVAEVRPLLRMIEPIILAVHPSHPLSQKRVWSREDFLQSCPLLLQQRWWQVTPMAVNTLNTQARKVADVPMEVGKHLVHTGLAAGFFPKMLIQPELDAGVLVPLEIQGFPSMLRETALVQLARRQHTSPIAQHFAGILAQVARSLDITVVREKQEEPG
ncbi:LysR family transcriptional regulator [Deinococcus cellulosilyticus]|uniref:HTH lysR-type domain-containing protein n=1 Tax=Deinococcus cellulosilyticus (strain DSM 18568 / NBRC 106333 / KACC 11606 / 5516J-15) TaxID=1223518 RepID=A0A511NA06_DEIC1|nr:LysR family transcriptional regulator [Deinococcus cellulosilyticus]GEM49211.1 hypothetical protein DC3_48460 [Deinococcus cellulosilyticus NBRC 106333 = KACC 11606]